MSNVLLVFGDVVRFREENYRRQQSYLAKNKPLNTPLFCFVVLKTEEFVSLAAHLGTPGQDFKSEFSPFTPPKMGVLNPEDTQSIKQEIVKKDSPLPQELKDLVEKLK